MLYRRRAANIKSRMGNGSTRPGSCFKQFKKKLQNYHGEIVILFVDGNISCALDHKTPWSLFLSRKVTLPRGARSHIKYVLGLALYFYYLYDTNSRYVLNMRIFKLALTISAFPTIVLSAFNSSGWYFLTLIKPVTTNNTCISYGKNNGFTIINKKNTF